MNIFVFNCNIDYDLIMQVKKKRRIKVKIRKYNKKNNHRLIKLKCPFLILIFPLRSTSSTENQ